MDISKLDKAAVLATLYNHARVQGLGAFRADSEKMTIEKARKILAGGQTYFDYLNGQVMKVDLSKDILNTYLYNRDNGFDAAENAIKELIEAT